MKQHLPSTVLVTGASGRTGRDILRELTDTSLHVRALTQSAANRESLIEASADEIVSHDALKGIAPRSRAIVEWNHSQNASTATTHV